MFYNTTNSNIYNLFKSIQHIYIIPIFITCFSCFFPIEMIYIPTCFSIAIFTKNYLFSFIKRNINITFNKDIV